MKVRRLGITVDSSLLSYWCWSGKYNSAVVVDADAERSQSPTGVGSGPFPLTPYDFSASREGALGQGHILSSLYRIAGSTSGQTMRTGASCPSSPLHAIANASFAVFPINVSSVSYMLMVTALVALWIVALFSSRNLVRERAMKARGGLCARFAIVLPGCDALVEGSGRAA